VFPWLNFNEVLFYMLVINCHIFGYLYFSPNTFPKILQKTWWPLINSFKCIRERRERCQGFVLTSLLPLSHLLNFCKSLYELQPYSIMFKVVFFFYFSKGQSWSEWRYWGECRPSCGYGYGHRHRHRVCINPGDTLTLATSARWRWIGTSSWTTLVTISTRDWTSWPPRPQWPLSIHCKCKINHTQIHDVYSSVHVVDLE